MPDQCSGVLSMNVQKQALLCPIQAVSPVSMSPERTTSPLFQSTGREHRKSSETMCFLHNTEHPFCLTQWHFPLKTTGQEATGGSRLQWCCDGWWRICPSGGLWDRPGDVYSVEGRRQPCFRCSPLP